MRSSHLVFALLASGAVVCSTLACSVILGLDSFDKVDCGAGSCAADADAGVDATDAASPPDAQLGDVASNPTVWASWPMPNPVFDSGLGPDADPGLHFAIYDGGVPGTIADGWTGLIWALDTKDQITQQAASDYCASLNVQTQKWRLPSRIELVTLIDFTGGASGAYIDPLFLVDGGAKASGYWTSSPDRTDLNSYWSVDFSGPVLVQVSTATSAKNVICVTGGKARK